VSVYELARLAALISAFDAELMPSLKGRGFQPRRK
jgi:hypothetical protein